MSEVDKMLASTNREMEQSKRLLQELANELGQLVEMVEPTLKRQIESLRSARMATVNEISTSLTSLREIRKFFLEDSHQAEIKRLEEFVSLCERLRALKADGTLDAVSDTILNLALKTPSAVPTSQSNGSK